MGVSGAPRVIPQDRGTPRLNFDRGTADAGMPGDVNEAIERRAERTPMTLAAGDASHE